MIVSLRDRDSIILLLVCAQSANDACTRCHARARLHHDRSYHVCAHQHVLTTCICFAAGDADSIARTDDSIVRQQMNKIDYNGLCGYDQ